MKNKVIVITGPTASGKSDLAIKAAKDFNGEIISVDSRQVYEGMDLGTGKVEVENIPNLSAKEKKLGKCLSEGVEHYLLDIADPRKTRINMASFKKLADQAIDLIFSKGKVPILAGGTMLYLDAIVKGYLPPDSQDKELRSKLENQNLKQLLELLKDIDSKAYQEIDKKNKYRVVRAIETKQLTGKSLDKVQAQIKPDYGVLKLCLTLPREELYQRIDQRVDIRVVQGMIKEVKELHDWGLSWKQMESFGLEYRYLSRYLQDKLSKAEALEQLKFKTHQFAKKQLTWWRKDPDIIYVKDYSKARSIISSFLSS